MRSPHHHERRMSVTDRKRGTIRRVKGSLGKGDVEKALGRPTPIEPSTKEAKPSFLGSDSAASGIEESQSAGSDEEREGKEKRRKIESCDEYLEWYYAGKIKTLSEESIRRIGSRVNITNALRAKLIDDALKSDFSMDKTRQLFVLSTDASSYTGLERSLRDFARDVVVRHPVMASQDHESWFPCSARNDLANVKTLWHGFVISSGLPGQEASATEEGKRTSAADIPRARRNAFLCALIWRYAERQTSFVEFFRSLRSTILQSSSQTEHIERSLLGFLVSAQDKDRCGIADFAHWFHDQTVRTQNQADHYRQRLESTERHTRELDELLAAKKEETAGLNQQIESLRAQVDAAGEEIRVHKVHSKDDLERQRSRTLRALEDEIPVLADCLTALNRDPPKVEVAKEYLGAALDKLNNELRALREM